METVTIKLINFITNLDEEKQDRMLAHLDLLKRISAMTSRELNWTEEIIKREFGG